jgi:hypothetical protein
LGLPPYGRGGPVALQLAIEPLCSGPDFTFTNPNQEMSLAAAVETENDLLHLTRQQRPKLSDDLPQFHQGGYGDVAPLEIEDLIGSIVAVEAYSTSAGFDVEGKLGAIIIGLLSRNDGGVGHLALGDPAQCVTHERAPAGQLSLIVHVLQLAAAAFVMDIMRATGLHPMRRGLHHPGEPSSGKPLVFPQCGYLD